MTGRRMKSAIVAILSLAMAILCITYGRIFFNFVLEIGEVMIFWAICGVISISFMFAIYLSCIGDETYQEFSDTYLKKSRIEQHSMRKPYYACLAAITFIIGIVNYFCGQSLVNICFEVVEALAYYSWNVTLIIAFVLSFACIIMSEEAFNKLFDDSEVVEREIFEQEAIDTYFKLHKLNSNKTQSDSDDN